MVGNGHSGPQIWWEMGKVDHRYDGKWAQWVIDMVGNGHSGS